MKVSIIVPVYNAELYITECIESILVQTYKKFELILVNDGSTDMTSSICDAYAEQDNRISVIHKKNEGASSARNAGIDFANGDIVCFLDSDDYWKNPTGLQTIVDYFLKYKVDVVEFSCWKFWQGSEKIQDEILPQYILTDICDEKTKAENLEHVVRNGGMTACAWNKACKKSLFEHKKLHFREGVIAEDIDWVARLMNSAETFISTPTQITVYRKHKSSITSSINTSKVEQLISNLKYIDAHYGDKPHIRLYLSIAVGNLLLALCNLPKTDFNLLIPECRNLISYLKHKPTSRTKILHYSITIAGINMTRELIKIASFIKKHIHA